MRLESFDIFLETFHFGEKVWDMNVFHIGYVIFSSWDDSRHAFVLCVHEVYLKAFGSNESQRMRYEV